MFCRKDTSQNNTEELLTQFLFGHELHELHEKYKIELEIFGRQINNRTFSCVFVCFRGNCISFVQFV
jgi:hypothetical protein